MNLRIAMKVLKNQVGLDTGAYSKAPTYHPHQINEAVARVKLHKRTGKYGRKTK